MRKLTDVLAEQAKRAEDDRDLTSRSDLRKERRASEAAFIELARDLVATSPRQLGKLQLPELVLDAVEEARSIRSPPALARALKRVRRELRDADWQSIQQRLEALRRPGRALAPGAVEAWCDRLAGGDVEALSEFVATFPAADRQRLRSLVRNVVHADDSARGKALSVLSRAVRDTMSAPAALGGLSEE